MGTHRTDQPQGYKPCSQCFRSVRVQQLWVCNHVRKWDMCQSCGPRRGCVC